MATHSADATSAAGWRPYLAAAGDGDEASARALVLAALDAGVGLDDVVGDIVSPALAEAGRRWFDGTWDEVHEHLACQVSEQVLTAALLASPPAPGPAPVVSALVVCLPGDGHLLAARLGGALLARCGATVTVLGSPVPAPALRSRLAATPPTAVVVTATYPLALPGVREVATAAHDAGVAVLAGGAAFGADDRRARALGADSWAATPAAAARQLRRWAGRPPRLRRVPAPDREEGALLRLREPFVDGVLYALSDRVAVRGQPDEATVNEARRRIRMLMDGLVAAIACQDDTLVTELVAWHAGRAAALGEPAAVLAATLDALASELDGGYPASRRLLAAATQALPGRATG